MNSNQFNEKYSSYLEDGHYGLAIEDPEFIDWLDGKFQGFVKKPGFSYSQIKAKFGMGRFYCEGLIRDEIYEVEKKITQIAESKSVK
jgi:hypothetical protein